MTSVLWSFFDLVTPDHLASHQMNHFSPHNFQEFASFLFNTIVCLSQASFVIIWLKGTQPHPQSMSDLTIRFEVPMPGLTNLNAYIYGYTSLK